MKLGKIGPTDIEKEVAKVIFRSFGPSSLAVQQNCTETEIHLTLDIKKRNGSASFSEKGTKSGLLEFLFRIL